MKAHPVLVKYIFENVLTHHPLLKNSIIIGFGIGLLSALAQIKFFLPHLPVPITGQTFGVTLIALNYGRNLATLTVGLYIVGGLAGLPLFAAARGGFIWGPTSGYLIGMFFSALFIGALADRGVTKNILTALIAGFCGSFLVFTFGAAVLSSFIPVKEVFWKGIFPFLPGDIIKTTAAAFISSQSFRYFEKGE